MKPTDEHLTDEDIFGVPGYDEDPEGREEVSKRCEICSGLIEIQFHTLFFDGIMKADICFDCLNQGDVIVMKRIGTVRWKRILGILGVSHEDLLKLADGTGRLPEPLRQPVLKFLQDGEQEILDKIQAAYEAYQA